jgi:hypothetical protein
MSERRWIDHLDQVVRNESVAVAGLSGKLAQVGSRAMSVRSVGGPATDTRSRRTGCASEGPSTQMSPLSIALEADCAVWDRL